MEESIDIDTLKRSCKGSGLSDQGTKAELWGRLKCGSSKKAKKPAAPAADAGPHASYVFKEYSNLKATDIGDEEEINEIINKRWKKAQELSVASVESNLQIKDPQPNHKTSLSAETDAAPVPLRKGKWNFELMDGFHEAAISWASKTIESRLMDKKRQKQNLVYLCPNFNIPVFEDTKKRHIAQELARNLLHYTDDEEE